MRLNSTTIISGRATVKNSATGMRRNTRSWATTWAASSRAGDGQMPRRSSQSSTVHSSSPARARNRSSSDGRWTDRPSSSWPRSSAQPVSAWSVAVGCRSSSTPPSAASCARPGVAVEQVGEVAAATPGGKSEAHDRVARSPTASSLGRALGDQATVAQHADAVGEVLDLVEVVRREQHRRAAGAQSSGSAPTRCGGPPGRSPVVGSSRNSRSG